MKNNNRFACCVVTGLCFLVSSPSHAEGGTVDINFAIKSNAYAVQMEDSTITARGGGGTATLSYSSGGPFTDGAIATIQFASYSKKTISGLELEAHGVATFSSDDTLLLFERRSGDRAVGVSSEGSFELISGTGRFTGVSGRCKYKIDDDSGDWNFNLAKCQWIYTFPYR